MSRRIVVAFEGPKGSGKSCALQRVFEALRGRGVRPVLYCPTRPAPGLRPLEWMAPWLEGCDPFLERLYAARGRFAWARVRECTGLVLGDRSVLTSYATRWDGATVRARHRSIARVHRLQPEVRPPDHVVLFEAPVDVLVERTGLRKRSYGRRDETPARLQAAIDAYRDLRSHADELGLGHVRWHPIDATLPEAVVSDLALACVSRIIEQELS